MYALLCLQNFHVEGKSAHAMYYLPTMSQCNTLHFIQSVQYAAGVPSYSCNDQKKPPKMISGTNQLILIHTECHQNIRLE